MSATHKPARCAFTPTGRPAVRALDRAAPRDVEETIRSMGLGPELDASLAKIPGPRRALVAMFMAGMVTHAQAIQAEVAKEGQS